MPRSINDDYRHRTAGFHEETNEDITHEQLTRIVRQQEIDLAQRRLLDRGRRSATLMAICSVVAAFCVTALSWEDRARFIPVDIICAVALSLSVMVIYFVLKRGSGLLGKQELELAVEQNKEVLRWSSAKSQPTLAERRQLYREDIVGVIEQYQSESRRYRRIHNTFQSVVMMGSATTTTVAALDTARELTWQNVTTVAVSFVITLTSMYSGYYKFRERSYFLQQTADAIEEEANAVALGVGEYQEFGTDRENEALARFTQRVEALRNEQRRRQQQLDQPGDQPTPNVQPPA